MRLTRMILWAVLATIVATIALPFIMSMNALPGVWVQPQAVAGCGIMVLAYLIVALGCAVPLENGKAPRLMLSGIIAGLGGLAGWFAMIAFDPPFEQFINIQRALIWLTVWPCLMMVIGLLLLPKAHERWWLILRRVAIALLCALAAEICLAITFHPGPTYYTGSTGGYYVSSHNYEEIALRLGGALALLAGGAVVITFLSAWIVRFTGVKPVESRRWNYWLRCPRCAHEQDAQTGVHPCAGCGLRIRVEVA